MPDMDFDQTIRDAIGAAKEGLLDDWGDIKEYVRDITYSARDRMAKVSAYRLSGKLDDGAYNRIMEAERDLAQAHALSLKIAQKAALEKAINTIFDVILKAVSTAAGVP